MVSLKTMETFIGAIAGIVILAAIVALILSNIRPSLSAGTQQDIVDNGTETVANITENLPIAGLVLGFGFILVVLFAALRVIREKGEGGNDRF